jgi:hypothetical protein
MPLKLLFDYLTGNLALVNVPAPHVIVPPSTNVQPVFFFMIPQ